MHNMQKICTKYAEDRTNMQHLNVTKIYAKNMHKICRGPNQYAALSICKICKKICKKMSNMQFMQTMPPICEICTGDFADGAGELKV